MKMIAPIFYVAFTLMSITTHAQTRLMINAGLTSSEIKDPILPEAEINESVSYAQPGVFAGIDLHVSEGQFFTQFGLAYHTYSSNSLDKSEKGLTSGFDSHSKLHQAKAKILAGIYVVPRNKYAELYVNFGVHPFYILSQSEKDDKPMYTLDELERLSVGGSAGIGVELFNHIVIEASYEVSFNQYLKIDYTNLRTSTLSIGYIF